MHRLSASTDPHHLAITLAHRFLARLNELSDLNEAYPQRINSLQTEADGAAESISPKAQIRLNRLYSLVNVPTQNLTAEQAIGRL